MSGVGFRNHYDTISAPRPNGWILGNEFVGFWILYPSSFSFAQSHFHLPKLVLYGS
jgi:hypothetical protein